jgi:multidrug efflux pump subunit AcrB
MDIALSGKKMRQFGINANTVFTEIETSLKNQPLGKLYDIYPLRLDQPLNKPEDFKKIMIPMQKKPAVMLGDFSAVTLKKNNGDFRFHVNGKPGVAIQIKETSTANPLEVSDELHEKPITPTRSGSLNMNRSKRIDVTFLPVKQV